MTKLTLQDIDEVITEIDREPTRLDKIKWWFKAWLPLHYHNYKRKRFFKKIDKMAREL